MLGCAPDEPLRFDPIRFNTEPPISLSASSLEIRNEFQPTFRAPYVEHEFPEPPQRALQDWVHDRLRAADPSSANHVIVKITDASVRQAPDSDRYDAHLALTIEIVDAGGTPVASVNAEASGMVDTGDESADDRDRDWYDLTRRVMADLDRQTAQEIEQSLGNYVVSSAGG